MDVRLYMDGKRIERCETPKMLKLEQDDVIEVMIKSNGGNGNTGPTEEGLRFDWDQEL